MSDEEDKKAAASKAPPATPSAGVQAPTELVEELPPDAAPRPVFVPKPKPIAIWKPADQVFLRTDEERVAAGLGLAWEECRFIYAKETRNTEYSDVPVKGVKLTGARK